MTLSISAKDGSPSIANRIFMRPQHSKNISHNPRPGLVVVFRIEDKLATRREGAAAGEERDHLC